MPRDRIRKNECNISSCTGILQESKTATQTKLEEIAARREALRKKYLARSHTESSIAIERKERFQRQGFNEGAKRDTFPVVF